MPDTELYVSVFPRKSIHGSNGTMFTKELVLAHIPDVGDEMFLLGDNEEPFGESKVKCRYWFPDGHVVLEFVGWQYVIPGDRDNPVIKSVTDGTYRNPWTLKGNNYDPLSDHLIQAGWKLA